MIHKVTVNQYELSVNLDGDYYGADFWDRISHRKYEPDTMGFIEDRCDQNTIFFDIGAANGAMSLIAASKGATVYAYEPDPRIFKVATNNFALNAQLPGEIKIMNKALSVSNGHLKFSRGSNTSILSDIIFSGVDDNENFNVEILSLADEISKNHQSIDTKLIIKMDIEGAEWTILQDNNTLNALSQHSAQLLLAVHPGFYRAYKPKNLVGIDFIRVFVWHFQNYLESKRLFSKLSKYSKIMRTNLNPIENKRQFGWLVFAGYHEWVLEFESP